MYLPPDEALLATFAKAEAANPPEEMRKVPNAFLKLLLQFALVRLPFDEADYLAANPDVAAAVKRGEIASGRLHFLGYGYFEGRPGGLRDVDAGWYLKTYPDVAEAITQGTTLARSATDHYRMAGAVEGRAPYAEVQGEVAQLQRAMGL